MAEFKVAEARPQDCLQISRVMRRDHIEAYLTVGCAPHKELRDRLEQSSYRRAWFIDGDLAGVCGVTGSALSPVGFIWCAFSQEAMRYPVELVKESRSQLSQIMTVKNELRTTILTHDRKSIKFAQVLGFQRMELQAPEGIIAVHLLRGAY